MGDGTVKVFIGAIVGAVVGVSFMPTLGYVLDTVISRQGMKLARDHWGWK